VVSAYWYWTAVSPTGTAWWCCTARRMSSAGQRRARIDALRCDVAQAVRRREARRESPRTCRREVVPGTCTRRWRRFGRPFRLEELLDDAHELGADEELGLGDKLLLLQVLEDDELPDSG